MIEKPFGTIAQATHYSGLSRTGLYDALKRGDITAKKAGRRTLVAFADLDAYIAGLPAYRAGE